MIKTGGKNELKNFGFSSKIEVPQLGSARNLPSSARLEPENFSSGSSLVSTFFLNYSVREHSHMTSGIFGEFFTY